jgi:hypothetical protein
MAVLVVSLLAKALTRMNPSPSGPNPTPGVVTAWVFSSSSLKKSQDEVPFGVFAQM